MMNQASEVPGNRAFEFQNWTVYAKSVEFVREAHGLCGELPANGTKSISDQLRRASQSIVLNIAEGSGRFTKKDKANFFRISRGSVFECVAVLDMCVQLGFLETGRQEKLEAQLANIGKMLSGLIRYVETLKH